MAQEKNQSSHNERHASIARELTHEPRDMGDVPLAPRGARPVPGATYLEKRPGLIFGSLIVFGVLALLIGLGQLFWGMDVPVGGPPEVPDPSLLASARPAHEQPANVQAATDTDSDGLTDYEEINVYGTSPYIEDTDSDGILDGDEIEGGGNPACPIGQDCSLKTGRVDAGDPGGTLESIPSAPRVDEIREMLVSGGLQKSYVDDLSDEDVSVMYQSALIRAEVLIDEIDAGEIRQTLVDQGVPPDEVNAIGDKELMSLMLRAIVESELLKQ